MSQNVDGARTIIEQHFRDYRLSDQEAQSISASLMQSEEEAINFLLTHHYEVKKSPRRRGVESGLTMGVSYVVGGICPLLPYFWVPKVLHALIISSALMAVILFAFGWFKTSLLTGFGGMAM